jgi:hypothetical protein
VNDVSTIRTARTFCHKVALQAGADLGDVRAARMNDVITIIARSAADLPYSRRALAWPGSRLRTAGAAASTRLRPPGPCRFSGLSAAHSFRLLSLAMCGYGETPARSPLGEGLAKPNGEGLGQGLQTRAICPPSASSPSCLRCRQIRAVRPSASILHDFGAVHHELGTSVGTSLLAAPGPSHC